MFSMLREGLLVAGGNETSIQREAETADKTHARKKKPAAEKSLQLILSVCRSLQYLRTSLVAQMVKRLSTMWETWVQALG